MSLQQRSKNSSPYKDNIQSILQSPVDAYWKQLYHSNNPSPVHGYAQIQNNRSVVQRLLRIQQSPHFYKSRSLQFSNLYTNKGLLVQTQQKIFAQVLTLLDEIDKLKLDIVQEAEGIKKLQIERPQIEEQVKFHGYGQKLTVKQCNDLMAENDELDRKIDEFRLRNNDSLQQILKIERQKYEDLKRGIAEIKLPEEKIQQKSKINQQSVPEIKKQIESIERQRKVLVRDAYPDFDRIKQINQQLRLRTIQNLKNSDHSTQQLIQLREFYNREEQNRVQFMEQLKKFKAQYKKLKQENLQLKQKLSKNRNYFLKENDINSSNRSGTTTKSLQKQAYWGNKNLVSERFGQFESIIQEMRYLKN